MPGIIGIVQVLLTSVVGPLIAKYRAENPNPSETDATALAGLNAALAQLDSDIADLVAASGSAT